MTPWYTGHVEALRASAAGLTFDEPSHVYRLIDHARPVVSVTQVLRRFFPDTFQHVKPDVLERKRQIGSAAHLATHYDDRRQLDEATVAPEVAGYLESYRRFLFEHGAQIIATELRLSHPTRDYAGTIDKLYVVGDAEVLHMLDLATGDPSDGYKHLQTAAYAELVRASLTEAGITPGIITRAALQLDANGGRAHLHPYPNRHDWRKFAALRDALAVLEEELPHVSAVA